MRYHYENTHEIYLKPKHAKPYWCDHPVYSMATLYLEGEHGLCLIQQKRSGGLDKATYWSEVDPWLADDIYEHPGWKDFFDKYADVKDEDGFYPTIPVRKVMWALKMKPLKKYRWETTFDHMLV